MGGRKKFTYDEVKLAFELAGCKLLSKEYVGVKSPLEYECSCGNISLITYDSFKQGHRCKKCSQSRAFDTSRANCTSRYKPSYQEVFDFFKEHGCELLSLDYIHSKSPLEYRCSCGNVATTEYRNFKSGKRCLACCTDRALSTIRSHHNGILHFETSEFKEQRKQTSMNRYGFEYPMQSQQCKDKKKQTSLDKYGFEHPIQHPEVKRKQRDGFRAKYGVDHFMHHPPSKERFHQTLMENHGVPSLAYLSRCASAESQRLFDAIYGRLDTLYRDKCHYASLNREFTICYKGKYFKYDFVQSSLKRCIEFNGYNFHPKSDQNPEEINWCAFHPNLTVQEARDYEALKFEGLMARDFRILIVWDYELHRDFDQLVGKCIDFLLGE